MTLHSTFIASSAEKYRHAGANLWQNPSTRCGRSSNAKACKEVFHPCAIEIVHIIIFLLIVTQSLTTNIWHSHMDAALVGAIMSTNFKIEELSMSARRASCIPNHYISHGPQHKITNPHNIPKVIQDHGHFIHMRCILGA